MRLQRCGRARTRDDHLETRRSWLKLGLDSAGNGVADVHGKIANRKQQSRSEEKTGSSSRYFEFGKIAQFRPSPISATQCQPDNSTPPSQTCTLQNSYQTWNYSGGNTVKFTDENGNQWQRTTDGLGRLTQAQEPGAASATPTLTTNYTYDLLDNLVSVNQLGTGTETARQRSFSYDSLSQLRCASNPESATASCPTTWTGNYTPGTTGYTYDANGNVASKTDARGIVTSYTYDALNRLLTKTYALSGNPAGTPSSCYQYDTATNGAGRLGSAWTQDGSCSTTGPPSGSFTLRTITGYDEVGRIINEQQCTPTGCVASSGPSLGYRYDLAGNPITLTNSVGAATNTITITSGFDGAAHLSSVVSSWGNFPTCLYVLGAANTSCTPSTLSGASYGYGPAGPLTWAHGANLSVTQGYTNRLWVNSILATGQVP